jgi:DnaJ domain
MSSVPALRAAITLLHLPSQAALIRAGPLPGGVPILMRIVAGDAELTNQVSASEGHSREMVREAASFFVEQVLLHADADSYRVLGATREASHLELRRNMTLLLQWLHPDRDHHDPRSVFAQRVTRAWNDLKTPERRAAYDRARRLAVAEKSFLRTLRPKRNVTGRPLAGRHQSNRMQFRQHATLQQLGRPHAGFLHRFFVLLMARFVYGSNKR